MQRTFQIKLYPWLLSLVLLFFSQAEAATRVLDRIELSTEKDTNVVSVYFNIPVRYVSHLINEAGNEVGVQLKLGQTADIELSDLVESDQLTWSPTAAVPLEKVEFQGNIIGTSTLLVSFAAPVGDVTIRQGRDFYVMQFILPQISALAPGKRKAVDIPVPETRAPLSVKSLPLVIYVINLSAHSEPVDFTQIPPVPVGENQLLYTTKAKIEERTLYRLRLGFFRTKFEAQEQLKALKNFYPDAWIDTADIQERRQAFFDRGIEHIFSDQMMEEPQLLDVDPRLTEMMEMIRRTITAGDYAKAVRLLEALLEEPENIYSKEALELLGLSRERNNQIAHAKGEYRRYLEKYPEGEDAERVWQRLLGLETAPMRPKQPLRKKQELEEGEDGPKAVWDTYGSLSQNYRRDSIDSPFVEDEDSVTRSEIETFVDLNARRRSQDFDMRFKITGSYILDLLDDGDGDDTTLSDAYIDVEHLDSRASARFGRQRLRSSGILNRFDGLVLGYQLTPDITLRATAGLPVERSRDTFLHEHKQFAGLSADISSIFVNWDLSLFAVEQRVDDLVDRRAIGGEVRYFDPKKSLFSLLDYDIFHEEVSIFMLQGNLRLEDDTRMYMNLDYRNTPILSTSNALSGQVDPDTSLPIESIEDLQNFFTDDEIYQLARDRTAETTSFSFGISHPLSETLQLSGDITVSKTGETPASGGVQATEETDNEFFYTFQVIKNDLLKKGDIGIFSLRYSDANTSDTFRLGISSRYPITNAWRINPRLNLSYRKNDDNDGSRKSVSPFLRMDYRFRKSMTFELEAGLNWFEEDDGTEVTDFTDYFFYGGYRWDF
ncbi:MAG: SPOR domain-containing protein [Candidatus Thiodiazotropha sp.]